MADVRELPPAEAMTWRLAFPEWRTVVLSAEALTVNNLDLKRDTATFHLHSGIVCFVAPVQGKVTGAVFVGNGVMSLDAPNQDEKKSLRLLTKEDEFLRSKGNFGTFG